MDNNSNLYNKTRRSFIYIYMLPKAGQTAVPIGLHFYVDTHFTFLFKTFFPRATLGSSASGK